MTARATAGAAVPILLPQPEPKAEDFLRIGYIRKKVWYRLAAIAKFRAKVLPVFNRTVVTPGHPLLACRL
jgi:hypothetical protein